MPKKTLVLAAAVAAAFAIGSLPAMAATGDGRLGGPPDVTGVADDTLCPAGEAVTGIEGLIRDIAGAPVVAVATVECTGSAPALGTMGSGGGVPGSTGCPEGQVAVGITGREGDFVDHLALRCRNADGSGPITTSGGFGSGGGTPDGPYDCPAGTVLTGLRGETVFAGTTIRYVEIVCAARAGRLGGPPDVTGVADDTLCPAGEAVTGIEGLIRDIAGAPVVAVATVECTGSAPALGTMGSGGGVPGSTGCPEGQVAVGITGREGDFVDHLALRCRNADGSGPITTSGGFGSGGGTPDGPYDCPAGTVLTGLRGETVFAGTTIRYVEIVCAAMSPPDESTLGDYDGDGDTDVAVFRPSTGVWFVQDGITTGWGTKGDIPVPGDYDGDGDTDVAVFRPSTGVWFVNGGPTIAWGTSGDIPVPGDYDGDGDTDVAVFRPSTGVWFVNGGPTIAWGTSGDIPVPGDYDGDGDTDVAVFRPSTGVWFVNGGPTLAWGTSGDIPVPGDYDGDGDTDVAVFRPSTGVWFVNGAPTIVWGTSGDIPVPGDYDGDGDTDVAVFRPSNGYWFVNGGALSQFGTKGDIPLPLPYAIASFFYS